jgi:RHS repeat-associated protein
VPLLGRTRSDKRKRTSGDQLLPAPLPRTRTLLTTRCRWRNSVSVRRRASGRVHYNYFRDYDPAVGGYIQSDPIGLGAGSFSAYAYVGGDPLGAMDPLGLQAAEALPSSPTPAGPSRPPGRVIPFPNSPAPSAPTAPGASPAPGLLAQCAAAFGLAFFPTSTSRCADLEPPPDANCPQNEDLCRKALARLFRVYYELTRRAIPQYMYSGTQGTANAGHYSAILQLLIELQSAIRMVELYCKPDQLPLNFERMKQIAGQTFPMRH